MQAEAAISSDPSSIELGGVEAILDCSGALWLPASQTLVVSDLHFEKGSHYAARGQFLPPFDTRATLDGLERLMGLWRPRTVVSLGDAFHDVEAERRMDEADAARLERLSRTADWIWVLGNHDPLPPKRFAGSSHEMVDVGGLRFSHEPGDHAEWQVAGHLHPCAVAQKGGRGVRRPAFISDGQRMVMPAFGAFTGGLNILDEAFAPHFSKDHKVHLCGEHRVYRVPLKSLRPDGGTGQRLRTLKQPIQQR